MHMPYVYVFGCFYVHVYVYINLFVFMCVLCAFNALYIVGNGQLYTSARYLLSSCFASVLYKPLYTVLFLSKQNVFMYVK